MLTDETTGAAGEDRRPGVRGDVADGLRRAVAATAPVPLPGAGRTFARMEVLAGVAGDDLSVGRLFEGHCDALAILAEAGGAPVPGAIYGVWAARSPREPTLAARTATGWQVSGRKEFCSGVGIIDRALVTVEAPDGYRLVDIDLTSAGVAAVDGSWVAVGMAGSASLTVVFDAAAVADDGAVGEPGFYLERPGFWFGAAGVAASWYGGAAGLVANLMAGLSATPADHALTELGRAVARVGSMRHSLQQVAEAIDADPLDASGRARFRAMEVRETVHAACVQVLAHVASAGGARPLGHDAGQSRRTADLFVYLSQHHGASDAAALGRLALDEGTQWS